MSRRDEIDKLTNEASEKGVPLTAEMVVSAAKNNVDYPELHAHLWGVAESELAQEARVARAHRLLISIRVVTEEGTNTRMMVHTPGETGYRPVSSVVSNYDLAATKLKQLADDVARSRQRLAIFKAMIDTDVADQIDGALEQAEKAAKAGIEKRPQAAA